MRAWLDCILEWGWYPGACGQCQAEPGEFINGKPACIGGGECKIVPRDDGLPIPRNLLALTGLSAFWRTFIRAVHISPPVICESYIAPQITMIGEIGGTVEMDREEFWTCCEIALDRLAEKWNKKKG